MRSCGMLSATTAIKSVTTVVKSVAAERKDWTAGREKKDHRLKSYTDSNLCPFLSLTSLDGYLSPSPLLLPEPLLFLSSSLAASLTHEQLK